MKRQHARRVLGRSANFRIWPADEVKAYAKELGAPYEFNWKPVSRGDCR
jgi:hypothetical protein